MNARRLVVVLVALVVVVGAAVAIRNSHDGQTIVIVTGDPGGTTYTVATLLQPALQDQGYTLEIRSTRQTSDIVRQVATRVDSADVAVIVGTFDWGATVDATTSSSADVHDEISSVGTIMTVPVAFAARSNLGVRNLSQLKGKTVGIRLTCVCQSLIVSSLASYGVNAGNTSFRYLDPAGLESGIHDGTLDAVATTLPPGESFISPLLDDGTLDILDVPESEAIARRVRFAVSTTVPRGTFRIHPALPPQAIDTPGLLATVVTRSDLNESAVLALAVAIERVFAAGTAFSSPHEYPNFSDPYITPNQAARNFYETGEIPWQFRYLPDWMAEALIPLLLVLTLFLLVSSIYAAFFPEAYSLWTGVLQPRLDERRVGRSERHVARGRPLSKRQRRRLHRIVDARAAQESREQRAEALLRDDDATRRSPPA
ncbi:MAG: TAXI family TRAP transporter solute-binding subunit [Gaiellales bacterium]